MNERIVKIVNGWNPIEIYPLIENEYVYEIKRIEESSEISTIELLAKTIYRVFNDSFGNQFKKSIEDCEEVAKQIINYL